MAKNNSVLAKRIMDVLLMLASIALALKALSLAIGTQMASPDNSVNLSLSVSHVIGVLGVWFGVFGIWALFFSINPGHESAWGKAETEVLSEAAQGE